MPLDDRDWIRERPLCWRVGPRVLPVLRRVEVGPGQLRLPVKRAWLGGLLRRR